MASANGLRTGKSCQYRRWILAIGRCVAYLGLAISLAGNVYCARRQLRDFAISWLRPDQPIVRVEPGNRILGAEIARFREQVEKDRHEDRKEIAALREYVDNFIVKQSNDLRDDLDRLKTSHKEIETSLSGFRHGVSVIRGELIRSGHLPKEYSTAF